MIFRLLQFRLRMAGAPPPKASDGDAFFVPGAIRFFPPSAPQTGGGKVQMKQSRTPLP
jgi:hypothetical protein